MANIVPSPNWDEVPLLDVNTYALGGSGGPANDQAKALANRIEFFRRGLIFQPFDPNFADSIAGYPEGSSVRREDGVVVTSTLQGNLNDPNVDMTGWEAPTENADQVRDASAGTQQDVNDFGGKYWYSKPGGYALHARVILLSGAEVVATESGVATNPNEDMSGWFNFESDVKKVSYANYRDLREFGTVYQDQATDQTALVLSALSQISEGDSLYIPRKVLWAATSNPAAVYAAMPDNSVLIDDSGYEDRYGSKWWQASQQTYYKTKDYLTAGRANGNTFNIRSNYHNAFVLEVDAPKYTGGAKGSIVWRANNDLGDSMQLALDQSKENESSLRIASYGTLAGGVTTFIMGAQSSIAPHGFFFNGAMIQGLSYVFGKMVRRTQGVIEDLATWQAAPHTVRWSQVSGNTGSFIQNWVVGNVQKFRQTLYNDGIYELLTESSARFRIMPDGGVQSKRSVHVMTTSKTFISAESGSYVSNVGVTGGTVATLPKAVKGLWFEFSIDEATRNLRVQPNAADGFLGLAIGKYKESSTLGNKLKVTAITDNIWGFELTGTWIDQS